jgi:hypothetical protein
MIGELDEHQGRKTTQLSFPGATVIRRNTRVPPISTPTT